jgi:AraC family transcriptional regulator, ethanolamine operon transcriptional activator
LTKLVLGELQLARETRSTGVLQRGAALTGTWAFGLPLVTKGSLHKRRRPAPPGQLLVGTSRDDVGLTATGAIDLMVVVLPTARINHCLQVRRGIDQVDVDLPSPRWRVPATEMTRRAQALCDLLQVLSVRPDALWSDRSVPAAEAQIVEVILELIPSPEIVEPLHSRARIARAIPKLLLDRLDDPLSITELCLLVGARERTLYLSCVEAFGRPPLRLLAELRLNATHRVLQRPSKEMSVTAAAAQYGFSHFGRFSAAYRQQFGELPSATLTKARGR